MPTAPVVPATPMQRWTRRRQAGAHRFALDHGLLRRGLPLAAAFHFLTPESVPRAFVWILWGGACWVWGYALWHAREHRHRRAGNAPATVPGLGQRMLDAWVFNDARRPWRLHLARALVAPLLLVALVLANECTWRKVWPPLEASWYPWKWTRTLAEVTTLAQARELARENRHLTVFEFDSGEWAVIAATSGCQHDIGCDMAVLRDSRGAIGISRYHYCGGNAGFLLDEKSPDRPRSLDAFYRDIDARHGGGPPLFTPTNPI